jgi:ATP phosphoribosyltransferase
MGYQSIRFALPKGRFLSSTAQFLEKSGLTFSGYDAKTRRYCLESSVFSNLVAKVFQEKDIPVQVAMGNYDFGICGLDWIEELQTRYPASALISVANLGYGNGSICVAASKRLGLSRIDDLPGGCSYRIVSEYPNLAESMALAFRLGEFRIIPVWGAAEVYPPENADLAVLWHEEQEELSFHGLTPLAELFPVMACLIANKESLESKDLSQILGCLSQQFVARGDIFWVTRDFPRRDRSTIGSISTDWQMKKVKLALPDGHQHKPAAQLLERVGLSFHGYSTGGASRRPRSDLDWLGVKVIRPQDMPLQVANGNFDLAITGEDWLKEHLSRFPSSPVEKLLGLGFGGVRIVVAISQDAPVDNVDALRTLVQGGKIAPIRVASEYVNLADKYLRDNRITPYKLVPTWGASEAFLPDDADLLIDNTETGKTLERHRLKVIDVLFHSSACLVGNKDSIAIPEKKEKIDFFLTSFHSVGFQ